MKKGDKLPNDETVLRRVFSTDKRYIDPSGRPTSRAFVLREKDNGKLSVNAKSLTTYLQSITDEAMFRLFSIKVEEVTSLKLDAIYSPSRTNNSHSHITNFPDDNNIVAGLLARKSKETLPF